MCVFTHIPSLPFSRTHLVIHSRSHILSSSILHPHTSSNPSSPSLPFPSAVAVAVMHGSMQFNHHHHYHHHHHHPIVAQKFWEPIPVRTSSFASILPSMSKELLRSLELKLLDHLGFNTTMEPEMYEHYCQELRALFYTVCSKLQSQVASTFLCSPNHNSNPNHSFKSLT